MSRKKHDRRPNLAHLTNPKPPTVTPDRPPRPQDELRALARASLEGIESIDFRTFMRYIWADVQATGRVEEFYHDLIAGHWPHSSDERFRQNLEVGAARSGMIVLEYGMATNGLTVVADLDQRFIWMGARADYEYFLRPWIHPTTGEQSMCMSLELLEQFRQGIVRRDY